ncbi:hypothetical protein [Neorhizobium sp. LjRoot104]|uniref:hypothetical protein n=1 Tax=Neorhizobium sp. LjRoot104 TaxID=3342254 RepID=UPI003F4FECBF
MAAQGKDLFIYGKVPDKIDVRNTAQYVRLPAARQPFVTGRPSSRRREAAAFREQASGLLALTISTEVPTILMWFRAEHIEVLKGAGEPHKDIPLEVGATCNPGRLSRRGVKREGNSAAMDPRRGGGGHTYRPARARTT